MSEWFPILDDAAGGAADAVGGTLDWGLGGIGSTASDLFAGVGSTAGEAAGGLFGGMFGGLGNWLFRLAVVAVIGYVAVQVVA